MKYLHSHILRIMSTMMLTVIAVVLLSGCQKAPINGDLDGQWQVMDVTPEPEETVTKERLYYCFYMHTCQLTEYGDYFTTGNFIFDNNTITINLPNANSPLSVAKLKQYGIYKNPVAFTVKHLDKKKLILQDGDVVVTLRKF